MLVVDDNNDAAEFLALLIETMGFSAKSLSNPEQVLRLVEIYRPHVVLLDLEMPRIDGFEVCRRLRRTFGEDLRVVALTGYGSEEDRAKSRQAGFDAHLLKPPSPELVTSTLEELCAPRGWPSRP